MMQFSALLPISAPSNVFLLISAPIPISAILKIHRNKQHFLCDTVEAFRVEID